MRGGLPVSGSEALRRRQLAVAKRRATLILAAAALLFVGITLFASDEGWAGYAQAAAEAAIVGGMADWFAVTALFRHPLGVPIPHTAIIVERKDQFAETLGAFVQESFLTPDAIVQRLQSAEVVTRVGEWLAQPENARRAAATASDGLVTVAGVLPDDSVERLLAAIARDRIDELALAPLVGRGLAFVVAEGRHAETVDAALVGLERALASHREELRRMVHDASPWWLPGPIEDRVLDRFVVGARAVLAEMAVDRDHELRRSLDAGLVRLAERLQTSPELYARGEELKARLITDPMLRDGAASVWTMVQDALSAQVGDPDSHLRRGIGDALAHVGRRLADDDELRASVDAGLERVVRRVVSSFGDELSGLVSSTIARWDTQETSSRLELLLGPDLQYIRINGTIVGAVVGLAVHAVAQLLG